jgi:exonuclease III
MIGGIWNIRGLNNPVRILQLADFMAKHKPEFICLSETKKEDFSLPFLDSLTKYGCFSWNFLPAVGTAGGVLVGINEENFEVISWSIRTFSVAVVVKYKKDKLIWNLVYVYGSTYEEHKQEFLDELDLICTSNNIPIMIGGDFNLIRDASEKNNDNINQSWVDKFNNWVNQFGLMEIKPANRLFT